MNATTPIILASSLGIGTFFANGNGDLMIATTNRRSITAVTASLLAISMLAACTGDGDSSSTTAAPSTTPAPATTLDVAPSTTAPLETALTLAYVEPPAGLLGDLATAQRRGLEDAVNEINAAGGVLGGALSVVTITEPRSGDVGRAVTDAVAAGAHAIVGPAGSSSAAAMLPALDASASIACSGSATAPSLSSADTTGRFFRTAVSDEHLVGHLVEVLRGRLAEGGSVTIAARDDTYGTAVGGGLTNALTAQGIPATLVPYSSTTVLFASTAAAVAATGADQVVMVSYGEGSSLLAGLIEAGIAPTSIIGLEGTFMPRLASLAFPADPTRADGTTLIGTTGTRDYMASLIERSPQGQVVYAPQVFDCTVALALAAQAAGSAAAGDIAAQLPEVTAGGVRCSTYADCASKLRAGEDIDYDGRSGTIGFDEYGDPSSARFTTTVIAGGELSEASSTDIDIAAARNEAANQASIAAASFTTSLQGRLRLLGFYSGPIDGVWDDDVVAALAAFQASVGLPATGVYDGPTDEALRNQLGAGASAITQATVELQLLLTQLGLYTGPVDGIYSQAVIDAVKALQAQLGVPQTGIVDAATLRAAYERGLADAPQPPAPTTTVTPPPPPTSEPPPPPTTAPAAPDLVDTLAADPRFTTLAGLIIIAGLGDELAQPGPFTIFAPTNDAFAALGNETLAALFADPAALRNLLLYHVVPGAYPAGALVDGPLATLAGPAIGISTGGGITVNGTPVVVADLGAANGIIHGVAAVLSPATPA